MPAKFKIAIASGKGGVGKSMLTSCLATLFAKKYKVVAVDCDVDAPNLNIWLGGIEEWDRVEKISTSQKAVIDRKKCTNCGKCASHCQFSAIKMVDGKPLLNLFLCEGCGACKILCPANAIKIKPIKNGKIKVKKIYSNFNLFSGQLYPGETGSGKIVAKLKEEADKSEYDMMIIDSSPGTGCPVIASLQDANFVVLITEPTPSGFSDLKRVLEVVNYFRVSYGIVINKWDINKTLSKKIEKWAAQRFLGKISYEKRIFEKVADLQPIMKTDLKTKKEILNIFSKINKKI